MGTTWNIWIYGAVRILETCFNPYDNTVIIVRRCFIVSGLGVGTWCQDLLGTLFFEIGNLLQFGIFNNYPYWQPECCSLKSS